LHPIKKHLLIDSIQLHLWKLVTSKQVCASLNHRKVKKAEPSRLISRKLAANLEVSIVVDPENESQIAIFSQMLTRNFPRLILKLLKFYKTRYILHIPVYYFHLPFELLMAF